MTTTTEKDTYMENYNPSDYPAFAVTVDLNIFTIRNGVLSVLLVKRGGEPFLGSWALPGGFVQPDEDAEAGAWRELGEETGVHVLNEHNVVNVTRTLFANDRPAIYVLHGDERVACERNLVAAGYEVLDGQYASAADVRMSRSRGKVVLCRSLFDVGRDFRPDVYQNSTFHLEQLKTYSAPDRDPRMRVVSVAYVAMAPNMPDPVAGDDAADARWWAVEDLFGEDAPSLAFDHFQIVQDALERVRAKLEYTTLALQFVDETFTLPDLRRVYGAVWGHLPENSNFRRKVLGIEDFLIPTDDKGKSVGGGPRPVLYRAGNAKSIQPPLMRDDT